MNKRILLPTDFSKNALNAIRYALDFYKDQECEFYLLNAFTVNGYSTDSLMVPEPGERAYEMAKNVSEKEFQKLLDILQLHGKNAKHTFHTIATYNSLLYAVKVAIAQKDIDLVIMGTKGATGSDSIIFGTNAVEIMEKVTECPVMAIPENCRFTPPKEVVFPTDYKSVFKRRELQALTELPNLHNTAIKVLHIAKNPELSSIQKSNKQLLGIILGDADHSFHTLTGIKVKTGINSFIDSRGSDIIAFLNKKHRFFKSMFTNPLVKNMGYDSKIPVLVLNTTSEKI